MIFLKKNLFKKFAFFEFLISVLGIGIFFGLEEFQLIKINLLNLIYFGGGFLLFSLISFYSLVTRPFRKILREIKSLLTGKKYNRLYTKKIDEVGVITHFFNEVTHSLERVSTDIKEHRRISTELNIAQKIQRDLLPKETPEIPGLEVIAKTRPAVEIGGDSFDFINSPENTIFYIGDVTGHGVPAGLVMVMVDTLIHTFADLAKDAYEIIVKTNKYLKPRIQANMFMTMVMFRWHHPTSKMHYVGAGHEHILVYHTEEKTCEVIRSGGIAIGMVENIEKIVKENEIPLRKNDFLILYSDGIIDAKNPHGEMFTLERLRKIVEKFAPRNPSVEEMFNRISTEVTKFIEDQIQEDDMSLIVIKYPEKTEVKAKEPTRWEIGPPPEAKESLVDYGKEEIKEIGIKEK